MYASFRFLVEFAREPDSHLQDLLLGWITRGQILCIPMLLAGAMLIYLALKAKPKILKGESD